MNPVNVCSCRPDAVPFGRTRKLITVRARNTVRRIVCGRVAYAAVLLCINVKLNVLSDGPRPMVEVVLTDAWVWDMYRKTRFVPTVRVVTFKDVNVEELPKVDQL